MHAPRAVLRTLLRTVPDALHEQGFARLVTHLLRGQSLVRRLPPLVGRCLALEITDTGNRWRFRITATGLERDPQAGPWDVRIRGPLADLLALAARREDPDTLFFARRLSLEGDTEAALYLKNLLDALEFDLDAHLEAVLGPLPAALLPPQLRRLVASSW